MSEKRVFLDYLNDILENIADIKNLTVGLTSESFITDEKTMKAVVKVTRNHWLCQGKRPNILDDLGYSAALIDSA